jgi:DNA-binding response OmpR family regulator
LKILVVEDDPSIRQIMRDLLKMHGYEVSVAADGENGLKYLQSQQYDLMITDLGLPGISGWDLALASKRYQTAMPVLAISSWQGKEVEKKFSDFGIDAVIWKPFRFDQIKEAIGILCVS